MDYNACMDVEEPDEDPTFLQKLSEKPCLLLITFIIFCGYGLSSVVFDWLWVSDMLSVQEALVFGPPDELVLGFLITVATVGTITFTMEVGNFANKVRSGEDLIPEDLAQLLSLVFEEVPQITLNCLLASCREIPMSYYALVKAALAMFGSFLRSTTMFCNYIRPGKKAKKRGFFPWLFRTAIMVACAWTFVGACLVWIFTYSEPTNEDADGGGFRPPDSISKSYDTDRYLYKSGIFFRHPNFAHCNSSGLSLQNWVQLAEIYDVTDANGLDVTSTFAFSETENFFYFNFPDVPGRQPIPGYETCYRTDLSNCAVTSLPAITPCTEAIGRLANVFNFTFFSLPRTKTIVFGDIVFNASVVLSGACEYPIVDTFGNLLLDSRNDSAVAQMQYFRVRQGINDTAIGMFLREPNYRYYEYDAQGSDDGDLLNVTNEWKTGYQRCDMSGSLRPNPREFKDRGDCEVTTNFKSSKLFDL